MGRRGDRGAGREPRLRDRRRAGAGAEGRDLRIGKGDFVSFIGPSGCGKTTFLRVAADWSSRRPGTITVNGMSPDEARRARAYGYVFQAAGLFPWRTIGGQRPAAAGDHGLSAGPSRPRGWRGCWSWSSWPASRRSIPGSCRAGCSSAPRIARALAFDADILLMDEPFGALDEIVRDRLNEELLALWARTGKTIAFVTHSIPEAVYLSTRIVVMSPAARAGHRRHREPAAARAPAAHPREPRVPRDRRAGARRAARGDRR